MGRAIVGQDHRSQTIASQAIAGRPIADQRIVD